MSSYPMYYDRLIANIRSLFREPFLLITLKVDEECKPSSAGSKLCTR